MSVSRDGHAGAAVCLGDGPENPLDSRGHAGLVGRAFQDGGFDSGAGDAFLNVANEHIDHQLGAFEHGAGSAKVEVHRHVVVCVDSGRDYDVQFELLGDPLYAGNIAAQPDYSQVDNRVDAGLLEFGQPGDGVGDPLFFIAPVFGVVLSDLG